VHGCVACFPDGGDWCDCSTEAKVNVFAEHTFSLRNLDIALVHYKLAVTIAAHDIKGGSTWSASLVQERCCPAIYCSLIMDDPGKSVKDAAKKALNFLKPGGGHFQGTGRKLGSSEVCNLYHPSKATAYI